MVLELLPFVVAGFAAGFVDAIAGGGGLITVPVLLGMGLPPHTVLATNKGQACLGAASSLATYVSRKGVDRERLPLGLLMGFVGALIGASLVLTVPQEPLRPLVLGLLLLAALVSWTQKRLARPAAGAPRRGLWLLSFMLAIGAYDGFFGPGTGMLLIVGFVHWFGDGHTRASGNAKVVNFGSNLASLLVFQAHSAVLWHIALPMGIANVIGAALGARVALRRGDSVVRGVVIVGLLAVSAKIVFDLVR